MTLRKIHFLLICLLLFTLPAYSEDTKEQLYEHAVESFRSKNNQEALDSFQEYIENYPGSNKVDDCHWYMGRLYRRMDQDDLARQEFLWVLNQAESNRDTEAFYDLSSYLVEEEDHQSMVSYFQRFYQSKSDDNYLVKTVNDAIKSYYNLGRQWSRLNQGIRAHELYAEGLEIIEYYQEINSEELDIEDLASYRIRTLIELAKSSASQEELRYNLQRASNALQEHYEAGNLTETRYLRYERRIEQIAEPAPDWNYNLISGAEYNQALNETAFFGSLDLSSSITGRPFHEFSWELAYEYQPFSFKSFNFNDTKTGDQRFYQTAQRVEGEIEYSIGNRDHFQQTWSGSASLFQAEDPGDNNFGLTAEWDIEKSLDSIGSLTWDSQFSYRLYPDYNVSGNSLDHFKLSTNPALCFLLGHNASISAEYQITWKHYLDAHYDRADGSDDPNTKFYIIHQAGLDFDVDPADWLQLNLGYSYQFLDSYNYNSLVYGSLENRFVEDYFDYQKHRIDAQVEAQWGIYRIEVGGSWALRQFQNYPARDEKRQFLNEHREDQDLTLFIENDFQLYEDNKFGEITLFLHGEWEDSTSNHLYDNSYLTNFQNTSITMGLKWQD